MSLGTYTVYDVFVVYRSLCKCPYEWIRKVERNTLIVEMSKTEISYDNVYYLFAVLSGYPVSIVQHYLVHNAYQRHIFNVVMNSLCYLLFVGYHGLAHLFIAPLYVHVLQFQYKRWKLPIARPWFIFILLYLHLGYVHYMSPTGTTAPFMMMIIRLVSYIWQVTDSNVKYKETTVLSLYGYCFATGGFFSGPTIDYDDYLSLPFGVVRTSLTKDITLIWQETLYILIAFFITRQHTYFTFFESEPSSSSFSYRLWTLPLMAFHGRLKYYFVWKHSEAICRMTGISADKAKMINIPAIEFATSFSDLIRNWNISTARYLHTYVYQKLRHNTTAKYAKRATVFTFLLSGYWHGFQGGYYLSFASSALLTLATRSLRRRLLVASRFIDNFFISIIVKILGWIITQYAVSYIMAPFVLLNAVESWQFYRQTYFFIQILCMAVLLLDHFFKHVHTPTVQ